MAAPDRDVSWTSEELVVPIPRAGHPAARGWLLLWILCVWGFGVEGCREGVHAASIRPSRVPGAVAVCAGYMPLLAATRLVGAWTVFGRARIRVGRRRLYCDWVVGPFQYSWNVPRASVSVVESVPVRTVRYRYLGTAIEMILAGKRRRLTPPLGESDTVSLLNALGTTGLPVVVPRK